MRNPTSRKEAVASNHAKQRIKERCGVSKKSADRVAALALERGVEKENTKGSLRKWLDNKYAADKNDGKIVVYGDKAYIFSNQNVLITCLQIPAALTKNIKKMMLQPA